MANLGNFDANQVEPNVGFDPIPAGKYVAAITNSQMKLTKQGNGEYLELEFEITDGEYAGRKVWDRLCLSHPNQTAVEIARGTLSAICRAVGVMQPQDSAELHNLPLAVTVKCKKRSDNDEMANEISGYAERDSLNGKPQQATQTVSTSPWRK